MKALINIISITSLISLGFDSQIISNKSTDLKRSHVQQIYNAELGVRESTGKNDGQRIEEYLLYVRLNKGDPWCAAFVCWVFDQAGVVNPRTGWSPALLTKSRIIWERSREVVGGRKVEGKKAGRNVVLAQAIRSLPQKGDVFGIWFPDKGRIAHVGFVDCWGEKWLITVEGNTNDAGSREGDGVWRKRRLVQSVYQVSQFVD